MKRRWMLLIIIIGSVGIISDFIYDEFYRNPDVLFSSLRLFKYFTIQSNLIVIAYFLGLYVFKLDQKSDTYKHYIASVVICIFITFSMFAIFLESIHDPDGLGLLGSISLHYVVPILAISYLLYYRDEFEFKYSHIKKWPIYPFFYLTFAIIHGTITSDYLYPFLDINSIGIFGLLVTIVSLIGVFLLLSFLIVKIVSKKGNDFS